MELDVDPSRSATSMSSEPMYGSGEESRIHAGPVNITAAQAQRSWVAVTAEQAPWASPQPLVWGSEHASRLQLARVTSEKMPFQLGGSRLSMHTTRIRWLPSEPLKSDRSECRPLPGEPRADQKCLLLIVISLGEDKISAKEADAAMLRLISRRRSTFGDTK